MMSTYCSKEKKEKLTWLDQKVNIQTLSDLQIQKFLFFNEMFNRQAGNEYNLKKLCAYEKGPVFSDVYGDIRHDKEELLNELQEIEPDFNSEEEQNLKKSLFITSVHTDKELSDLTHLFDLWKSKENRIKNNEYNISIKESDITEHDEKLISLILNSAKDIDDYNIIKISGKIFLIKTNELDSLTQEHSQILEKLSNYDELVNPVYLSIEDGVMLVD